MTNGRTIGDPVRGVAVTAPVSLGFGDLLALVLSALLLAIAVVTALRRPAAR